MEKRWLDGFITTNIRRDKKERVCFTDLTLVEQKLVLTTLTEDKKDNLILHLAGILRACGDKFELSGKDKKI